MCCLSVCTSQLLNFFQPMTTGKQLPAYISTHKHAYPIFSPYSAAERIEFLSKHLDLSQGQPLKQNWLTSCIKNTHFGDKILILVNSLSTYPHATQRTCPCPIQELQ